MSELLYGPVAESVTRDLQKCKQRQGYKPIWILAAENNAKPKRVIVRNVKTTRHVIGVN